jgi:hypothetical protein
VKIRKQKPLVDEEGNRIKGGRPSLHPCVDPVVEKLVLSTANKFKVSKSFVQNTLLAEAFGLALRERFDVPVPDESKKPMAKASVRTNNKRKAS